MRGLIRKQVYITEEQELLLKRAARKGDRSEAEVLREALDHLLRPKAIHPGRSKRDALWGIVGVGRTPDGNVALDVDHHLYGAPRR